MWLLFESCISFLEMLTSCYFAFRIFGRLFENRKEIIYLLLFSVGGTVLMTLREWGIISCPDFLPSILMVGLYSYFRCKAKWWGALLWALVNYLLIGVVTIVTSTIISMLQDVPMEGILIFVSFDPIRTKRRVVACVLIRLMQLLVSELILLLMKRFRKPIATPKNALSLITVAAASIMMLVFMLWNQFFLTEEFALVLNIFTCLLILCVNFLLLFVTEIISQEKRANRELEEINHTIRLQVRNQAEISEMYQNMRALRHDMNNHLHTISGYIQLGEGENAQRYIEKIAGEIIRTDIVQTGKTGIDALLAAKGAVARSHDIKLQMSVDLPEQLYIPEDHLVIVLGNLYDNAMDANLKVEERDERFIHIVITYQAETLIIGFENAAVGEDRDSNYRWITTKHEKGQHGYGLKNIDRIVKSYDGECIREQKNGVFISRIRMSNEEK